jgi:hypothetical protein
MFDYDQVDTVSDDTANAIAADIGKSVVPDKEPDDDRDLRLALFELDEQRRREQRDQAKARYEFDLQREQERQQQAARAVATQALKEKWVQQQRDRDALRDRERIAALTEHHRREQARHAQDARQRAVNDYWQDVTNILADLDRLCNPPPPDWTAARISQLEDEIAWQADQAAADAERHRSAKYQADQRAAVVKREAGGW